ncbi:MAG: Denitrification system component NirT [Alphaproteobacteria bacterium HGW-Alphaproteobacteria-2]|nr:MAG: Denitrification system component NirT [Alphaproteobacteria bacterium HGW-Alphaproteobacteria-2]
MRWIKKLWHWFWTPAHTVALGLVMIAGFVAGIIFWGGFHTAMEATNTLGFCISCHEMRDTVYQEYKESSHYKNASGVRAVCSDCHVPHAWGPKLVRKVQATGELWAKVTGKIDTPEKFEAHRWEMANRVWATMQQNDSRECRNCHSFEAMDFHVQGRRAAEKMQVAMTEGETCISCHKGIAHRKPVDPDAEIGD